jgi:hypothetical protein
MMTETPPEAPVPDDTPTADGVPEDRLTGYAFYDTLIQAYTGGVYPSKAKARKGEEDCRGDRYVLRRV